jgi:hypothetical protein
MDVIPLDPRELAAMILAMLVVLIPLIGFTVRFATRPNAAARLREGAQQREMLEMLERRVALLEQELQDSDGVRANLARVLEEVEFQRQLLAAKPPS